MDRAPKKIIQKDRYGNQLTFEFESDNKPVDPTRLMEKMMEMQNEVPEMGMPSMPSQSDHPGEPRGSDTVPAWLTPGEFVVNKEATDMYGPQIEAMNNHGRSVQMMLGGNVEGRGQPYEIGGYSHGAQVPQLEDFQTGDLPSSAYQRGLEKGDYREEMARYIHHLLGEAAGPKADYKAAGGLTDFFNKYIAGPKWQMQGGGGGGSSPVPPQGVGPVPAPWSGRPEGLTPLLHEREGFRDDVYIDTTGNPTVGYGHKLPASAAAQEGTSPYSQEQLGQWFDEDSASAVPAAVENVGRDTWVDLNDQQQAALASMAFQLGASGQAKFKNMIEAIQAGDNEAVQREAKDSKWYEQTPTRVEDILDAFPVHKMNGGPVYLNEGGRGWSGLWNDVFAGPKTMIPEAQPPVQQEASDYPGSFSPPPPTTSAPPTFGGQDIAAAGQQPAHPEPEPHGYLSNIGRPDAVPELQPTLAEGPAAERALPVGLEEGSLPEDISYPQAQILEGQADADAIAEATKEAGVPLPEGEIDNLVDEVNYDFDSDDRISPKEEKAADVATWFGETIETEGDQTAEVTQPVEEVETAGQNAPPAEKKKAESFISEAFGDLFDKKELARMAIMYTGSRLLGNSHLGSLQWSAKNYIARIDANAAGLQKNVADFTKSGKYSPESIASYSKSGNIADLKPIGASYSPTGNTKTVMAGGKKIAVQEVKGSDGGTYYQTTDGTVLNASQLENNFKPYEPKFDTSTPEGREYRSKVTGDAKERFEEIRKRDDEFKTNDGTASVTKIGSAQASDEFFKWANDMNIDPGSDEALQIMTNAYQEAIADGRNKDTLTPTRLRPYLENQFLRESTGYPDFFITNPEAVAAGKEQPRYIDAKNMGTLRDSVSAFAAATPADINEKQVYKVAVKEWAKESNKDLYEKKGKKAGTSGFYVFMQEKLTELYQTL